MARRRRSGAALAALLVAAACAGVTGLHAQPGGGGGFVAQPARGAPGALQLQEQAAQFDAQDQPHQRSLLQQQPASDGAQDAPVGSVSATEASLSDEQLRSVNVLLADHIVSGTQWNNNKRVAHRMDKAVDG